MPPVSDARVPCRPSSSSKRWGLWIAGLALAALAAQPEPSSCTPAFTDETLAAGLDFAHGFEGVPADWTDHERASGGVAAGDYDGDGFIDLFLLRGAAAPDVLLRNRGDGTFEDATAAAGIDEPAGTRGGPVFVDYDGDGALDLIVPGLDVPTRVHRGLGDGRFADATLDSGLVLERPTFAAAFGDHDRDGDLDVYLTHWATLPDATLVEQLFENEGGGVFSDATVSSGIAATIPAGSALYPDLDLSFAPVFADFDGDGWPDLLVTGDFGTSQLLRNRRDGTFEEWTSSVIDDENGMGSAVGDFDGDCDLDWFVTSVFDTEEPTDGAWGISGNRLYRNDGAGGFENVTEAAGVRNGGWGWGACFADFDNDGDLDLFHTNGWFVEGFAEDRSRLFLSKGDGTFSERAVELGVEDRGMGRGVACFDADRDGDIDLLVANLEGPPAFYRNAAPVANHWLGVRLAGPPGNTQGAGARIWVKTTRSTQMREIQVASRFASQDPAEAHFGLGASVRVLAIEVLWPDGRISVAGPLVADRLVTVSYEDHAVWGARARLVRSGLGCQGS